jgi:DNA-binding response OmpR family regulator
VKGLDFVRSQREKGCKCSQIALMSADWSEEDRRAALEMGCRVFAKPFSLKDLSEWLDDVEAAVDPERKLNDWDKLRGPGE